MIGALGSEILALLGGMLPTGGVSAGEMYRELASARKAEWDQGALDERRAMRAKRLVAVVRDIPFYSRLLPGGDPASALQSLPVLERDVIGGRYGEFISPRPSPAIATSTSGSTRAATLVLRPRKALRLGDAALLRALGAAGLRRRPTIVQVFPWPWALTRRPFYRDRLARWITIGLPQVIDLLRQGPIQADAVLSSPEILLRLVHSTRARILSHGVLFSSYEWLDQKTRAAIQDSSGLHVFDLYSATEFCALVAFECTRGGLHVNDDYLDVEIVDRDGVPVPPGRYGDVVVTDLINNVMPLVRYRVGDVASRLSGRCSCGRALSLLAGIHGRSSNLVQRADGGEVAASEVLTALRQVVGDAFTLVQTDFGRFRMSVPLRTSITHVNAAIDAALGPGNEVVIVFAGERETWATMKQARFISAVSREIHRPPPATSSGR